MAKIPLVSIVIPVYNAKKYLSECINSIIAQEVQDWELLLVDDGSTDDSGIICDGFAVKDNRIKVFHKENGGVSSARNLGIENARGKWLMFVDADDWVTPKYLNVVAHNSDVDYSILHFGYYQQYSSGRMLLNTPGTLGEVTSDQFLSWKNWSSVSFSFSFSLRFIKDNDLHFPLGLRTSEDRVFIACAVLLGKRMFCFSDANYYYRYNLGSAVHSKHPYGKNRGDFMAAKLVTDFSQETKICWHPSSQRWFLDLEIASQIDAICNSTDWYAQRNLIYDDLSQMEALMSMKNADVRVKRELQLINKSLVIAVVYKRVRWMMSHLYRHFIKREL